MFFHLSVLLYHVSLDFLHLGIEAFDRDKLVVWVCLLDDVENFKDLMVLVLHVDEPQFLPLVLTNEIDKLTTLLDLVQTFDEFVCESVNPLHELVLDLN